MALTIGVMIVVPDLFASIALLTWLVFTNTMFSSIQDVAVDGLAVDLLDEKERGRANGFMYASKWGGGFIGGWGLSHVANAFGLRTALIVQTILLFAIMLVPLFVRERSGEDQAGRAEPIWRALPAWLKTNVNPGALADAVRSRAVQSAIVVGIVMLVSNLGNAMLSAFGNVLYTQQLGWGDSEYVSVTSGPALIAGLLGSLGGGLIADYVGHRRLVAIAALLLAGFYLMWSLLEPHWASRQLVYSLCWIEPALIGVMTVSLFALCMDVSWKTIAASQFAIYMALSNFSSTIGFRYVGHAMDWFTNPGMYQAAAIAQASLVLLLPLIDPRAVRRTAAA